MVPITTIDTVRLKAIQIAKRLTNAELAQRAGLHPIYVDHFFHDREKSVRVSTVRKLASVLDINASELIINDPQTTV